MCSTEAAAQADTAGTWSGTCKTSEPEEQVLYSGAQSPRLGSFTSTSAAPAARPPPLPPRAPAPGFRTLTKMPTLPPETAGAAPSLFDFDPYDVDNRVGLVHAG